MISKSELESWWARSGKSDFSLDISRNSYSSFPKYTAESSCVRSWIDALILLQDSYTEKTLCIFRTLFFQILLFLTFTYFQHKSGESTKLWTLRQAVATKCGVTSSQVWSDGNLLPDQNLFGRRCLHLFGHFGEIHMPHSFNGICLSRCVLPDSLYWLQLFFFFS